MVVAVAFAAIVFGVVGIFLVVAFLNMFVIVYVDIVVI